MYRQSDLEVAARLVQIGEDCVTRVQTAIIRLQGQGKSTVEAEKLLDELKELQRLKRQDLAIAATTISHSK